MGFSALRVYQFRNLSNTTHEFSSREVFLIGENGQGKTNTLEALYLLCYGASFRTHSDAPLVRDHGKEAAVRGSYRSAEGNTTDIEVLIRNPGGKEIRMNEKRVKDRKDILLSIPCVVFAHDDLEFISGAPAQKRHFYNQTLCMYDLHYLDLLRNYKRVLVQRNTCLKQKNASMLDVYNRQLVEWGFDIQSKRDKLLKLFNVIFRDFFRKISGLKGEIDIRYQPSWRDCATREACLEFLVHREGEEAVFRTTTSGPHRDQFRYFYEGSDFCQIASTGQIRLLSIILRVAQACFFTEYTGKRPVLLLDDVLLELDAGKREQFIRSLPDYEQAFFTFLPDEEYSRYRHPTTGEYEVKEGVIQSWKKPEIF
jgi:DNA replication and repair protein RecF